MDTPSDFNSIIVTERPWGEFRVFVKNMPVTVKIVSVRRGEKLSVQYHRKRTEFWRILSGNPRVTIGEKTVSAKKNDEFIIPVGAKHSVSAEENDAEFLEIASGDFDEENDIVRLEDKYGRK